MSIQDFHSNLQSETEHSELGASLLKLQTMENPSTSLTTELKLSGWEPWWPQEGSISPPLAGGE